MISAMAHVHRFYIPPETPETEEVVLTDVEAHHALHVVRVQPGDEVVLFDGAGREIRGVVRRAARHEVRVEAHEDRRLPWPAKAVTIVQGWLHRREGLEYLVRRGTELGVRRFVFFRAVRSEREPRLDGKWRRIAIEACKQCGRLWVPSFTRIDDLHEALEQLEGRVLVLTRDLEPEPLRDAVRGDAMTVLAGPEGDFAPEELELAQDRGATPVSLGPATYRSEVAATLAAGLVLYEMGALGPKPVEGVSASEQAGNETAGWSSG